MPLSDANSTIVLAGSTGNLGLRIAKELRKLDVHVVALVRPGTSSAALHGLQLCYAEVKEVAFDDATALEHACCGAACVVSALSGLQDVIVGAQGRLLAAAVKAGVPRFIPSDFSLAFGDLAPGSNRNLELRQVFAQHIAHTNIQATSILNGAFVEMLTGPAPIVFNRLGRIVYWENAQMEMDFTAMDDVAAFTARAACDPHAPRFLRIAGDVRTAVGLAQDAGAAHGKRFKVLRAGSLQTLKRLTSLARTLAPQPGLLYPPWQGMQYLHNMFSGVGKLEPLDNDRYGKKDWITVAQTMVHAARQ